jgi:hypothetical protein
VGSEPAKHIPKPVKAFPAFQKGKTSRQSKPKVKNKPKRQPKPKTPAEHLPMNNHFEFPQTMTKIWQAKTPQKLHVKTP